MKTVTFKYFLDGKEITKTQAQNMFDNTTFTIKDGGVYFTTTVTPVSKFFSAGFQVGVRQELLDFISSEGYKNSAKEIKSVLNEQIKDLTVPPYTETDLATSLKDWGDKITGNYKRCSPQCFCDGSCKDNKNNSLFNSTRHKYNPARNVQDALQRAEEHQAQNGREENKEAERFGEGIYWMLRPTTEEEKKVISDLEIKQKDPAKGISQYETSETVKQKAGVKEVNGKLPIDRMITIQFPNAIQAIAKATLFGHNKYKETDSDFLNYQRVEGGSQTYADAGARHGLNKNELDKESGLPHIYHKVWNAMAELELWIKENN